MLSSSGNISLSSQLLSINGTRIGVPKWKSAHKLPGQSTYWNPAGIHNGYFTNLQPDSGPGATLGNPGARATLYQDPGHKNVEVSVVWSGDWGTPSGPIVALNPNDSDFGINFCFEPVADVGFGPINSWVLWRLGRQPNQIKYHNILAAAGEHVEGTPVELKLRLENNIVTAYVNNVLKMTSSLPTNLQNRTMVGVNMDVNPEPGRPKNFPCLVSPAKIVPL